MKDELKFKTENVSIQSIMVNGKSMSQSLFNQIPDENCFDNDFNFNGDRFLGFVFPDNKHLIYVKNGELRKHNLHKFIALSNFEITNEPLYNSGIDFLLFNKFTEHEDSKRVLTKKEILKLKANQKNAISFLKKISTSHLYCDI